MLKLFFWLLLIGNAALFAMQRGYLGTTVSERHEPKRLAQQLHPETLSILPANSEKLVAPVKADAADAVKDAKPDTSPESKPDKPEAKAEMISCIEIGNFNGVEARKFDAQLASLNLAVKPTMRNVQEAASHMVYIPSQDGKDGAERRSAELRRLGIQDFYVIPESQPNPALRWAISLGVFKTEEAAKAYIGQLIPKGVRSARIMARNVTSTRQAYQWRNVDTATKAALDGLKAKFPNQEMHGCTG
ncbi:SPOR domain-containing protein [Herbaspirillum sp. RV1423]|uniref:SPOR domain-containing protein n=1 Tax=Herbaspirillum sp. RV1423 TaxID=1443993 RepID=UPI0004B6F67E|nr:SPOR domain-containing protein [Herbaspirillum sp. RV1423]